MRREAVAVLGDCRRYSCDRWEQMLNSTQATVGPCDADVLASRTALGQELRRCRKARRLSQSALGSRIGKSTATICKIETGQQAIDVDTLLVICRELDTSPCATLLKAQLASTKNPQDSALMRVLREMLQGLGEDTYP